MPPDLTDRVRVQVLSAVANTSALLATDLGYDLSYHSSNVVPGVRIHVSVLALEPQDGNDCCGCPDQMENCMENIMSACFA